MVWIRCNLLCPLETLISIARMSDNRVLRTYASSVPPGTTSGTGRNRLFGAGTYTTSPADGHCFKVTGASRTSPTGIGFPSAP